MYKYISILNVCALKQENKNDQCGIFTFIDEVWIWKNKILSII